MIEKLFIDFFKEIESKQFKENKNSKADYWANELQEVDFNHENYIGKRKAERYYEKYIEGRKNVSVKIPNEYQRDFMSKYLGYKNYEDFKKQNEVKIATTQQGNNDQIDKEKQGNTEEENIEGIEIIKEPDIQITTKVKNWKKTVLVSISILSSLYIAIIINKDVLFNSNKCIVWIGDRYKKTSCFTSGAIDNSKHLINVDLFKKVELDSTANFFTNGKPNFWYGKNLERDIEYFTQRGLHPETGEELKPIKRGTLADEGLLNE